MTRYAKLSPYDYVEMLMDMRVPGYTGYEGGQVSLTSYLSANTMFKGNSNAQTLASAMRNIVQGTADAGVLSRPGFSQVFTGQGSRDNIIAALAVVNRHQAKFKAVPALAKYFKEEDFLQAMIDDFCFGLDCIGFVGTYLVESGVKSAYESWRPLDYAHAFVPVKTLDEIDDLAVVMLTNGLHIQMIDEVTKRKPGEIEIDLCQSSSGGPKCNVGVTLRSGGGNYLPVEEFRAALASNKYAADHAADNEARKQQGLAARNYEMYLRSRMTQANVMYGYKGGAIFQLGGNGEPKNPVGGHVYVGMFAGGLAVGPP